MPRFTVFTATYNRAGTLPRVYHSLAAQTYRDFEWLVVDDGSTDGTAELVTGWQAAAGFEVRYVRQANGGQHLACNRGLTKARGELFAMIDSDDACVPQALARMAELWDSIPAGRRDGFAGVGGLCSDERGRLIGDRFPAEPYDASALEMHFRDHVRGQKWWCVRTAVLRHEPWQTTPYKGPNPWFALARRYRFRLTNEVLKVFYQDDPEGSLSRAKGRLRPWPNLHRQLETLELYTAWLPYDPPEFFRAACHYVRCSLHLGRGPEEQWRRLHRGSARLLWAAALPWGCAWYLYDRRTKQIEL